MKVYEDAPLNTCTMGAEKEQPIYPAGTNFGTQRVPVSLSGTKAQTGASSFRVDTSDAQPIPTCE
jgi:hypothetical protein